MVFGPEYAVIYDYLYHDVNYRDISAALDRTIADIIGLTPRPRVLDAGCGTGNFLQYLCRDFDVTGVDLSKEMLAIAAQKCPEVKLIEANVKTMNAGEFDVVCMLSAVLGYQQSNADVVVTLLNVNKHLRKDGLFIFDIWHGPTVLRQGPQERVKEFNRGDVSILRHVKPQLCLLSNQCICTYQWWMKSNGQVESSQEVHVMRYFFPMEIRFFLEQTGFKLIRICQPQQHYMDLDSDSWHAMYIACKA